MSTRIAIDYRPAEGAVLRMIGLVERRGFQVRGIAMREDDEAGEIALDIVPRDPGRSLEVMGAQLRRLIEVNDVQVHERVSEHV